MPNPANVYQAKHFPTQQERDAYAAGLQAGINFECQPGSDPSRVRTEYDGCRKEWHAYIESGRYDDTGKIVWP